MQNFVGKTKCIVGYMKVADMFTSKEQIQTCLTLHACSVPDVYINIRGYAESMHVV